MRLAEGRCVAWVSESLRNPGTSPEAAYRGAILPFWGIEAETQLFTCVRAETMTSAMDGTILWWIRDSLCNLTASERKRD